MVVFQRLTVEQMISRCNKLPVCPVLYSRLTTALQNPTQNICDLGEIIAMDPVLTAKVLRAANSAYYGLTRTVRSVDDAIIRLGFEDIFSIAAAAKAKELFAATEQWDGFGENLWSHAIATAVFARTLARKIVARRVEDAYYTAALLHDFGKLMLCQVDISYPVLCDYGAVHGDPLIEREYQRYGASHAQLGAELLKQWKLPAVIVAAVENHHQQVPANAVVEPQNLIVTVADFLAHAMQDHVVNGMLNFIPQLPVAIGNRLPISRDDLTIVISEASRQIDMLATAA